MGLPAAKSSLGGNGESRSADSKHFVQKVVAVCKRWHNISMMAQRIDILYVAGGDVSCGCRRLATICVLGIEGLRGWLAFLRQKMDTVSF
jgi:hypothetical protein